MSAGPLTVRVERVSGVGRALTVIVSAKRFPTAVARNRIRRRIREGFRRVSRNTLPGYRCVIIVRTDALPPGYQLDEMLLALLVKSGIVFR